MPYKTLGHSRKIAGCTEGACVTLPHRHNFQASQAVQCVNDITTLNFLTHVRSLSVCGPKVVTLIYHSQLNYQTLFYLLQECFTSILVIL